MNVDRVTVQILGERDDLEELDLLTGRLRSELLDLDVESVTRVDVADPPTDAKGVATLAGLLIVKLGGIASVKSVLTEISRWATRNRRDVEVSLGGDVLKVSGISAAQQEKIIDAWIARHAGDA